MTTTDMPETPTTPPPAQRTLRRSRDGRVAAGVSSGLGEYFGLDPVLFRVLFATSAFFGGAGILAYLIAWAAIPEKGTERAPIDGFIAELRRRNVPPWLVAIVIAVIVWAAAFSWWLPGPFFPIVAVIAVLVVVFGRREMQAKPAPVDLTKHPARSTSDHAANGPAPADPANTQPTWVVDARQWWDESRTAARERRRRALPVKIGYLVALAVTLGVLALVDAATRIPMPVYFWATLAVIVLGLLVGLVLRRTPWSITGLLPLTIAGLVAFGGTGASFTDGIGERTWTPTMSPEAQYRLAFGQGVLDLRQLRAQDEPRTVRITGVAGQVRVLVPEDANVAVDAHVRFGQVDQRPGPSGEDTGTGGVAVHDTSPAPADATGARVTVDVELAEGHVEVVRS